MTFRPVLQLGPFRIDRIDGPGDDLAIAFASVGHDASRPPSPEFVATATGRGTDRPRRALFVRDESRSWASDPAFAPALRAAVAQTAADAPITRIATLGLSMGAFAALAAMQVLPVTAALAFGPQAAPHFPGERRWSDWTARLPEALPWPTAPLPGQGQGWACIFHGLQDDAAQAMAFPVQPGTDHFLFPDQSHSGLVPHLKARGVLSGLLQAALEGDRRRLIRIVTGSGGARRRAG